MNEVATIDHKPAYLATLADDNTIAEFTAGAVSAGMPYPTLSLRGKEFRVRWNGQETMLEGRHLDMILVAARPALSKRWYEEAYQSGVIEAPTCSSVDGIKPDEWIQSPVSETCGRCPKNQFGSRVGANGSLGKECGDYKRLVVLPLINGQPAPSPMVLDLSPNSLKRTKDERGRGDQRMFFTEYMQALVAHGIKNPTAVVTRVKFTSDEYPRLEFAFNQYADEALFNLAQTIRAAEDTVAVLEGRASEPPARIESAPSIPPPPAFATTVPAPARTESAPEAPRRRGRPRKNPEPQAVPQPVPEVSPPPQPVSQPVPQPVPQTAPPADVMSQVRSLLGGL